jgi:hypothetical protein
MTVPIWLQPKLAREADRFDALVPQAALNDNAVVEIAGKRR